MAELKYKMQSANQKYRPISKETTNKKESETERTLVSIVSATAVIIPASIILGKMLPDMPIYELYKYLPF